MTNLEKLRQCLRPYPDILAELETSVPHGGGWEEEEYEEGRDFCVLVDGCISWFDSPQGDDYWEGVYYRDIPMVPKGCWMDALGITHKDAEA